MCPDDPVSITGYIPLEDTDHVNISLYNIGVDLEDFVTIFGFAVSLTPSVMLDGLDIGNGFKLVVSRDAVYEGLRLQVNATLTVTDMLMTMDSCDFTLDVLYVNEDLCDGSQGSFDIATFLKELQSIDVTLNITMDDVKQHFSS